MERKSILESFRVLDLTDEKGLLCGRILADLGADVIKIERPGGDKARNIGPFYKNDPHPEKSLFWFFYNLGKRGITLNIESEDGKQIFRELVKRADFLIESFSLGFMDSLGLGYSSLHEINPRLIMTSISAFGQRGPYSHFKASDIVSMAMGGLMYITGNADEAPLRISFPQAFLLASAHAASATMIAHYYRESTGEGQYVDVSAQQTVLWEVANAIPLWELNKIILRRAGSYLSGRWTGTKQRLLWPCKDGYVLFFILGGAFGAKTNRLIVKWMDEEGMAPEFLLNFDWSIFDMAKQTQDIQNRIEEPIGRFFKAHTKMELYEGALKRGIMLCPVSTARDITENLQLKARYFWVNIYHPELKTDITYPGAFIKMSETPCNLKFRAPLIGEHNLEIYEGELGFKREEIIMLKQAGVI